MLIDLAGVLDSVVPMLGRLIGEHIAISVVHHGHLEPVLADAGQMEQVIVNLATNARDAMPDGGTLTMETGCSTSGAVVCLTVTDTGGGIDPEVADHVFEPFYTTKEQGRGTGLGLATAHGIVTQAGGRIHVYSEPGLGRDVPRAHPGGRRRSDAFVRRAVRAATSSSGSETILLCEDEDALRFMVGRILGDAGYTVLSAPGGTEALEIAAASTSPSTRS